MSEIDEYVNKSSWRQNANANWNYSFSGLQASIAGRELAIDAIDKFGKYGKKHKDGFYHLHNLDGGVYGRYCVLGSTSIQTIDGWVSANHIKIGDKLIGYNIDKQRFEHTEVIKIFSRNVDEIYDLFLERDDNCNIHLKITGNHEVLTNMGWKTVENLKINDEILYLEQNRRRRAKKNIDLQTKDERYQQKINSLKLANESRSFQEKSEDSKKIWQEKREQIMESRKKSKQYEKVSNYMKSHNPMKNSDIAQKVSLKLKGTRCGIENPMFGKPAPKNAGRGKRSYYKSPLQGEVCFRSSYELAYAEYLDSKNILWLYEPHTFILDNYISYTPDFYLINDNKFIEIKGYMNEKSQQKINLFNKLYAEYNLEILKLENLIEMKILKVKNGARVLSKKLLKCKQTRKRAYKFKVYNFECYPHQNYLANSIIVHNCSGNDLMKLLQEGLYNPTGISARPAQHLNTAIDHLINMTYIMTGEWQGAQAWSHMDIILAPYVREDGLNFAQVKQEMQRLIWSFSFPMRPNFQSPFVNLTFGLRPNKYFETLVPFVGDRQFKDMQYKDYQTEIDMINRAFLEILIGGANGHPFSFPLPTYNITPDFKWSNIDNHDSVQYKIFELAAKWGMPYFSNYVSTNISEEDMLSMCCRLRLDTKEVQKASGGIWNFGNNTGSLAVVTINMARLGYLSNGNEKKFYRLLDRQLEDSKNYLLMKKKYVKEGKDLGLFPMTNHYVGNKILDTYFLTVGLNGLNECSMNFAELNIKQNDVWCNEVLKYMREKVFEMQTSSGQLFNFEATPGEGNSYTLAKIDREKFDDIYTQGTDDAPYYTGNSMLPANMDLCAEVALKHQSILQQNYTGGCIFHIDEGVEYSPTAVAHYIRRTCRDYSLPYVTWSPTYINCEDHGKKFGKDICCDKGINYTRVVGYYRPVNRLNIGKKQEFDEKRFLR